MKKSLSILILSIIFLGLLVSAQSNNTNATLSNLRDKTDSIVEKQINIENKLLKAILNIEGPISLSLLIIIILFALITFIIIGETCKLIPILEGSFSWLIAGIIMILIGVSGGLNYMASTVLSISEAFKFLSSWSTGALIATIALLVVITLIVVKLDKYLKEKNQIAQAQIQGIKAGTNLGFMARMKDFMGF